MRTLNLNQWVSDSVKIHWISINIELNYFSGAILTPIFHWISVTLTDLTLERSSRRDFFIDMLVDRFIFWECLFTRLPLLKCISLGYVRSSHHPFEMHKLGPVRSSLPILMHVGSIATSLYLSQITLFPWFTLHEWDYFKLGWFFTEQLEPWRPKMLPSKFTVFNLYFFNHCR